MIEKPTYQTRTTKELMRWLKDLQNLLQMRDWSIELIYGDEVVPEFDNEVSCGYMNYEEGHLTGTIWVSPLRCKAAGVDPKFVVAHEVAHAFQDSHNEETRCNIIVSLLELEDEE